MNSVGGDSSSELDRSCFDSRSDRLSVGDIVLDEDRLSKGREFPALEATKASLFGHSIV